jgi:phospholipid N-methyltransferase
LPNCHHSEGHDLIICSLPLSFFPKKDAQLLLEKIRTKDAPGGKAIILFPCLLDDFNNFIKF